MKNIFLSAIFSVSFLAMPLSTAYAAEMYFVPPTEDGVVGKEIAVDLYLDTGGKMINALSGKVAVAEVKQSAPFSSSTATTSFTLSRIHDGDSIVEAWLTKASIKDPKRITFSGIIPGGTTGKGKIMVFYFVPKQSGALTLTVSGSVFENKASPSLLPLRLNSIAILIRDRTPNDDMATLSSGDVTPPVITRAVIAENNEMFDGKPFIIVNAKDSESGVATYELLEVGQRYSMQTLLADTSLPWRFIDNPAPLISSTPTFIYLRVTDREGNAAVVEVSHPIQLSPEKTSWFFNKWLASAILIGAAGLFLWLRYWYRRKHHAQ